MERDAFRPCTNAHPYISTHTLTWSVTNADVDTAEYSEYFNSHAHVERDYIKTTFLADLVISTHTLTWSVTISLATSWSSVQISTHTLTWSVTLDVVYIWCLLNVMRTYFFI